MKSNEQGTLSSHSVDAGFEADSYSPTIRMLSLAFLTSVIFLPCLGYEFVNWDDNLNVYANPALISNSGLQRIWTTLELPSYLPLTYTWFYLQHWLWGMDPRGYHAASIVLHTTNVLLVFVLLRNLGLRISVAWWVAALFAVHPVRVESVAWITEQKSLLSGLFYWTAIIVYIKFHREKTWWSFACSWAAFVLSLLAKPTSITLPITLLLLVWYFDKTIKKASVLSIMPFFLTATVFGFLHLFVEGRHLAGANEVNLSVVEHLIISSRALLFYPFKLLLPLHLSPIYPRWTIDTSGPVLYWPVLLLILTTLLLYLLWQKRLLHSCHILGPANYVIVALPILGLIPMPYLNISYVADRYQYLPSFYLFFALGISFNKSIPKLFCARGIRRHLPTVICLLGIIVFSVLTIQQNRVWKTSVSLWSNTIEKYPNQEIAHNNLGQAYASLGLFDKAMMEYNKAISINPNYAMAYNNLGSAHGKKGEFSKAMKALEKAVVLNPRLGDAYYNLSIAYFCEQKYELASEYFDKAIMHGAKIDKGFRKLLEKDLTK